ncbi:hypothetical protein LA345_41350 (plasmid) [Burkholderia vietnamiensis]|nr:hypothetical protein [Burkholderia vietnamiensis]
MPVDRDAPDLGPLQELLPADSECGKLIRVESTGAERRPVFVTRINRTTFMLHQPHDPEIEIALDDGTVDTGLDSTAIAALELELEQGELNSLYRVALELLNVVQT